MCNQNFLFYNKNNYDLQIQTNLQMNKQKYFRKYLLYKNKYINYKIY